MKRDKIPLREAVIDIRLNNVGDVDLDILGKLSGSLAEQFSDSKTIESVSFDLTNQPDIINRGKQKEGFVFSTKRNDRLLSFKANRMSVHAIGDYPGWDQFIDLTKSAWNHLLSGISQSKIIRIGLRYINEFHLQLPFNLEEYFNIHTSINLDPKYLLAPEGHLRFTVIDEQNSFIGVVQFVLFPDSSGKHATVTFDIDVSMHGEIDFSDLWIALSKLKEFRSDLFFSNLTEKTISDYNF